AVAVENGTVARVGKGMSLLWSTELPSGLSGLAENGGRLYTVCRDGFLYELDANGKVMGKLPFATDCTSAYRPIVASGTPGLAAAAARKLIILR
ncbi:MAG: PQQ-binding-like beta-propeller repeat protein, partial [Victivallales bacterium]|nr:PQQ-binding-like beta-propeller repeat protein [Victivallales bacterium]